MKYDTFGKCYVEWDENEVECIEMPTGYRFQKKTKIYEGLSTEASSRSYDEAYGHKYTVSEKMPKAPLPPKPPEKLYQPKIGDHYNVIFEHYVEDMNTLYTYHKARLEQL